MPATAARLPAAAPSPPPPSATLAGSAGLPAPTASAGPAPASPTPARLVGYAFNAAGRSVTRFDVVSWQALDTRPLDAVVTWLSNEQRFWDGRHIWTYDFPDDQVRAIAIDPRAVAVARAIPAGGRGPAHSLMLTPDLTTAWVNVAADDVLAAIDLASGQVVAQVKTGKFP